ncbi:MAG: DnaJ domain-containing protein [Candidatus Aminicenantes bacterium]
MDHIARYLKDIHAAKKSGRIIFRHKNIQKYLFFQDGYLIFAKTNQRLELFGEVLFKLGKIPEEIYSRIEEYIEPNKKIGESLIDRGIIGQKDLQDALVYQMKEIALNIFPYFDGEIRFQEIKGFFEQVLDVKIDVPLVIEEGIRKLIPNPSLQEFLEDKVFFPKGKDYISRLTGEERDILNRVNGTSSASEILRSTSLVPDNFWKELYLLYCLDLIDFEKKEGTEEEGKTDRMAVEEMKKRIDEVVKLSEDMDSKDYYQILNVSPAASPTEIKKSYFKLARKYHPDLFGREISLEAKERIEDVFSHITKAFQTLSDEQKRKQYDIKRRTQPPADKRNWSKTAEMKFRQGKTLFDQGMYEDALVVLGEAVRMMGDKGRYHLLLALTESKIPSLHKKAEQDFLKAIKLEPWNSEAYVGLGLLYKREGLSVKASKLFKKALSLDPDHEVARSEIGSLEKTEKKKGFKDIFSFDLFSKKKK